MPTSRNIWFFCPACDRKLVVARSAGGHRANCPECGVNIPIPTRSNAMPTWLQRSLIAVAQATAVGLVVLAGLWVWRDTGTEVRDPAASRPDTVAPAPVATAPAVAPLPEPLDDRPDESREALAALGEAHAALQDRYDKVLQWMMENYRGKYPLSENLMQRLRIAPLDAELAVSADLVEMLRLDAGERVLVQDIFNYVREELHAAEADIALVTEATDDRVTFAIPPYAEQGAALRNDLLLTLEDTLGAPRLDRLLAVAGQDLREQFHYFGEAERTLTFQIVHPVTPGAHDPYLVIRDGWTVPDGDSVRLTKVTETAVDALPASYRAYAEWLPEPMLPYAVP
jgi:hypothetical protein